MRSIRNRILIILLTTFVSIWLVMMTYTWYNTKHEIEEVFDAQLAQAANVLLGLLTHNTNVKSLDSSPFSLTEKDLDHNYEKKLAFQVWSEGRLLFRSDNAPDFKMVQLFGYSDGKLDNQLWRFLYRKDAKSNLIVIVGEEYSIRQELAFQIILQVFLPIIIALPILGFLIVLGVGKGLKPLQQLTSEVQKRSINQLSPISTGLIPHEVFPIVSEINQLLKKLKRSIDTERQFTADASHELRTPLAALKTQAQVAQRAKNDTTREHALKKIVEGVNRSSHLVEQLLTLARLDPESIQNEFEEINLTKITRQSIAQVSHIALDRQIKVSLNADKNITLNGIGALFEILIINLLKNSFTYTPKDGKVSVLLTSDVKWVTISVSDSGVGIPEELRGRIFDKFYRISGNKQTGSGLGLSIAKRIAEIHLAEITADTSEYGGAMVVVKFPI